MKTILRKENCLAMIEEKLADITNQKFKEMNDNPIANLHLSMAYTVLSNIAKKTTTKDILDTLIKLYVVKSLYTRIFLKQKLYILRMSEPTLMTNHINNLNMLFPQLLSKKLQHN